MKLYPLNMIDFQDMFPNEATCREYLSMIRWSEGFVCPSCDSKEYWQTTDKLYICKNCDNRTSLTAGTIFQNTHKPLRLWFSAIWYVISQKNGVSALGLQKALGLGSYHTAWTWLHKIRRAMVRPNRDRLSGIVEVDETFIGGKKSGKRGRGAEGKTLVLVAVEEAVNGIGRIRLRVIPDASSDSLETAICEMVEKDSTIKTDGWVGYNGLSELGYNHIVKFQSGISDEDASPLVHRIASLLKRWLLGTHQGAVNISHLRYYLDEYTFRFNRRTSRSRGKLFYRLVQQAVQIEPTTEKQLKSTYSG